MKNEEYRIKEHKGEYTIQVFIDPFRGWCDIDADGYTMFEPRVYESLEEAKAAAKLLQKGVVYHSIDD